MNPDISCHMGRGIAVHTDDEKIDQQLKEFGQKKLLVTVGSFCVYMEMNLL